MVTVLTKRTETSIVTGDRFTEGGLGGYASPGSGIAADGQLTPYNRANLAAAFPEYQVSEFRSPEE
jgi:hypothetical protein